MKLDPVSPWDRVQRALMLSSTQAEELGKAEVILPPICSVSEMDHTGTILVDLLFALVTPPF